MVVPVKNLVWVKPLGLFGLGSAWVTGFGLGKSLRGGQITGQGLNPPMIAVRELNMVKFKKISENDYPQKPLKLKMITSGHGIFDCVAFLP